MWPIAPAVMFYSALIWSCHALKVEIRKTNTMHFRKIGSLAGNTAMGHIILTVNVTKHLNDLHHACSLPKKLLALDQKHFAIIADQMSANCRVMQEGLLERKLIWENDFAKKRGTHGRRELDDELAPQTANLYPWEPLQTRRRRQKRQLFFLIGLAVAAIAVYVSGLYNANELTDIAEAADKGQETNIKVLQEHQTRLAIDERSIQVINKTISIMGQALNNVRELTETSIIAAQVSHALTLAFGEFTRVIRGLNSLSNRRLSPDLVRSSEMIVALTRLRSEMALERYDLGIIHYEEIFSCEVSHVVTKEGLMVIFLHIPAVKQGSRMTILQYIPVPTILNDESTDEEILYSMIPVPKEQFIAISRDETGFQEFTMEQMSQCKIYGDTYFCPNANIIDKRMAASCLMALYRRDDKSIERNCQWQILPAEDYALQLTGTNFLLYQRGKTEIKLSCGDEYAEEVVNGLMEVVVPPGCLLYATSFTFEGQVNFTIAVAEYTEKELNVTELLTSKDLSMPELIQAMADMHLVGSAEGVSIKNIRERYDTHRSNRNWSWGMRSATGGILTVVLIAGAVILFKRHVRAGGNNGGILGVLPWLQPAFAGGRDRELQPMNRPEEQVPLQANPVNIVNEPLPEVPQQQQIQVHPHLDKVEFRPRASNRRTESIEGSEIGEDWMYSDSALTLPGDAVNIRKAVRLARMQRAEERVERPHTVNIDESR